MKRIMIYDSETNVQRLIAFSSELDFDTLASQLNLPNVTDKNSFLRELALAGLSVFVDPSYEGKTSNYISEASYEMNVLHYTKLGELKVSLIKFITRNFDDEEVDKLFSLDDLREIYETDESLRRLISQTQALESSWTAVLNYLTRVYGFMFITINYYPNEEES